MRGRRPKPFAVSPDIERILRRIARDVARPYISVVRARILLARAAGERVKRIADRFQVDESAVWRIVNHFSANGFRSLQPKLPLKTPKFPTKLEAPPDLPDQQSNTPKRQHPIETFGIDWG